VGIKDLRFGYLVDECWEGEDCDAFLRNTSREIPFLPTANHYFMCATVSREPEAMTGRIVGDLLVPRERLGPEARRAPALCRRPLQPARRRQSL
jgi:hypothetical protein